MTDAGENRPWRRMDSRGVSEVIGFVLVFSLVLGSITMVYVGGFSALGDTRDAERVNNAERAFDVLADNFQQLGRGEAPRRATEIKLSNAQLTLDQRYDFEVNVSGNPTIASVRPMTYHSGTGTRIVYEHGAIIRVDDGGGAVMLREPDYLIGEERTVIRHLEVRGGQQSMGGTVTVLIRGERVSRSLQFPVAGDSNVSSSDVNVTMGTAPDRSTVWKEYFESTGQMDCEIQELPDEEAREVVACDLTTDSLTVSRTQVDVEMT